MRAEEGFVESISRDGWAQVITGRSELCGGCRASSCCSSLASSSKKVINALNKAEAKAGDRVTLGFKAHTAAKSAAIAYIIPVAGLIAGAVVGAALSQKFGGDEGVISALFALLGLASGFTMMILLSRWLSAHGGLTPIVIGIKQTENSTPKSVISTDPVCKMPVEPSQASASLSYDGKRYYFCAPGCKDSFLKNPKQYL
jgi:YHS domain-containing protein/positive regulator of sigma E activity